MADDVAARNGVARLNVSHQRDQRLDLRVWKRAIPELVTRIDDLDADACRIDVVDLSPV